MLTPEMNREEQRAYDRALEKIQACRREAQQGTILDLSNLGLTHLPSEIGQLTALNELSLHNNHLNTLPPEIGQLKALQILRIYNNRLTILPPEVGQITVLKDLSLANNQLTTLPPEIGQLAALKELHVYTNKLTTLPLEMRQLTTLTVLSLHTNRLTMLPPEIGQLTALTQLSLHDNRLTTLPQEIGQLARLETLTLERNGLKELPKCLQGLSNLQELTLHGNDALGLPTELLGATWSVAGWKRTPPAKPQDILDFYFAQRAGPRRPLNEVKVLVVGESEVGKTSLIRQLRGENHNPKEDKTHGIERHRLSLTCGRMGEVRLNVWDFGGQDIMHATHQFFLTHRSVYLLVLDSRQNERQSRIDYWLRLIASYGGNSPVIVVCNKADQQVMQLNWSGLQREYPQIRHFAKEVCCYHYDGKDRRRGLKELRQLIAQIVENDLSEVDKPILETWLDLKNEFEKDERPYLTLNEYHTLASQRGINSLRDREVLLTLMHTLGSVLHFSEHSIFNRDRDDNAAPAQIEELNVLDPGWVTGAIYKLLNDAELIRAGGTMNRKSMRRSLRELSRSRYPTSKEDFIITMMRRFEICFAFDGDTDRWFLPDLLHKDEVDTGDWSQTVGLRYQYTVLPGSVIGRVMVRLHGHIARHCLWRTGAKFKRGDCEALVRSEPEDARLDILIRGGTARERREFLALFRGTLADIHLSFSDNLGVKELVPVPGYPGAFVGYHKLLLLEEKKKANDSVEADGKLIEFSVSYALNGVTEPEFRDEERLRLSQTDENQRPATPIVTRTPGSLAHVVWWQSWPALSMFAALGFGVVVWGLMEWGNMTAWIIFAVVVIVFVAVLLHNPQQRFRRWFLWALGLWFTANGVGVGLAASWKNEKGEAMLKWDGAVSTSFNLVFAVVVLVTGFLSYKEWQKETHSA